MNIASFNVNSLRARLDIVHDWLKSRTPDILAVQETKVQDQDFPVEAFADLDYHITYKGQKSYNGVALFSKIAPENVCFGLEDEPKDESRLIRANINGVTIVNTYVPQGHLPDTDKFRYKLEWFARLKAYFETHFSPRDPVVWLGDLNVAPEAIDVHDPKRLLGHVCFCPEVTQAFYAIRDWGFVDTFRMLCQEEGQYTFWDYRAGNSVAHNRGWRIDHIMATQPLADKCSACVVDMEPRLKDKPSDHTPITATFDL
jgi:exodeoxyribonuclease-3